MKPASAIELAIENVLREGLTDVDIFSKPFEVDMLKDAGIVTEIKQAIKTSLKESHIKGLGFSPISHVLVPKKELFDFRKCALIEPMDELKYLSLVLQMAPYIETRRLNKSKNHIFSYRFSPAKGYLFDSNYNYTSFREFVSKKSKQRNVNVVVSCDISNFYDRLNIHRLECILSSIDKIDRKIVLQVNELLLFWSNRDSYGIPVGSNASRILAEAALIEIDNYLVSHRISYCRFVDDFRIFAPDAATAHRWLSLLVDRLSKEGLFLNTSKTQIKDVSMFSDSEGAEKLPQPEEDTSTFKPAMDEIGRHEISRIIRGYSGLIPTKFRALTEAEKSKLGGEDVNAKLSAINSSILIDPKSFVSLAKACVAQGHADGLISLAKRLNRFPQFIPYLIDAITKNEGLFSEEQTATISNEFEFWMDREHAPEFVTIYAIRFFGSGKFTNKKVLFECFRGLKRNDGSYIGRALLEQLEEIVERGEVLEIRDYYVRADLFERRQIAKMVSLHLTEGEKRPFFKNILSQSHDIFLQKIQVTYK